MTLSKCCGARIGHNENPFFTSSLLCTKCGETCFEDKPVKREETVEIICCKRCGITLVANGVLMLEDHPHTCANPDGSLFTYKPMKHEVKVGDRFKLGPWEWEVTSKHTRGFGAGRVRMDTGSAKDHGESFWSDNDASSLDWITPKVTFTNEQRQELRFWGQHLRTENQQTFYSWLDAHTEKE